MTTTEIAGLISTLRLGEWRQIEGVDVGYCPATGRYGRAGKDRYLVQMGAGVTFCYSSDRAAKQVVRLRNASRKNAQLLGEGD